MGSGHLHPLNLILGEAQAAEALGDGCGDRDGGRALLSIPNAAYAGLLAELMAGEFRYRPEGLLDETHLRFFTRRSLLRFLQENGCAVDSVETVQRQLPDSEFRVAFDALPPAAARHLLALPDALSYQFIVVARPAAADEALVQPEPEVEPPAQALFSTQLYWDQGQGFAEDRKLVATGVIGRARQTLRFALPAGLAHLKRLNADFDGDTGSGNIVCTDEAIAEVKDYLRSRRAYIGTDGKLLYSSSVDTIELVLHNMTEDPEDDVATEGYSEGEDSTVTHNGKRYSVDKLHELSRTARVTITPMERLEWMRESVKDLDTARVAATDLNVPLVGLD